MHGGTDDEPLSQRKKRKEIGDQQDSSALLRPKLLHFGDSEDSLSSVLIDGMHTTFRGGSIGHFQRRRIKGEKCSHGQIRRKPKI